MDAARITRSLATECFVCNGLGYTRATAAEMKCRNPYPSEVLEYGLHPREFVECQTLKRGSGCPRCHGTGQDDLDTTLA